MKTILLLFFSGLCPLLFGQYHEQYFDGADTNSWNAHVSIDTNSSNIWQIGSPQKNIFNAAATFPNAIVTDTVNNYPLNNSSSFTVSTGLDWYSGILAVRWRQKLDLDAGDFAFIEFSPDGGTSWENAFDSPDVYNFFGFDADNMFYDPLGQGGFSETDSSWKDIWLCYEAYYLQSITDTLKIRFRFESDSSGSEQEGWMIDNIIIEETAIHTVNENQVEDLSIYPTITKDRIQIEARKTKEPNLTERISLFDTQGKLIKSWEHVPLKYFIDISEVSPGNYLLKIETKLFDKTFQIIKE
jgi:hypothetical protein